MEIIEAIIHQISKAANSVGPDSVASRYREDALPTNDTLTAIVRDLVSLYGRSYDSQGTLDKAEINVFPSQLNKYLDGSSQFLDFTKRIVDLIAKQMENANFASGGYIFVIRYAQNGESFLIISLLKLKPGAGIDTGTLSLEPNLSIDLGKLNEAAQINLTRYSTDTEPYLTFIKGSKSQHSVTQYFRNAISCSSFTSSQHHTKELMNAADAYVAQLNDLTDEEKKFERAEMRKRLFDYMSSNRNEVHLDAAAAAVAPTAVRDFLAFIRPDGSEALFTLSDTFKPHRTTFNLLRKISGHAGNVKISFDVQEVENGNVKYDPDENTVIVRNPSDALREEILKNEHSQPTS